MIIRRGREESSYVTGSPASPVRFTAAFTLRCESTACSLSGFGSNTRFSACGRSGLCRSGQLESICRLSIARSVRWLGLRSKSMYLRVCPFGESLTALTHNAEKLTQIALN